MENGDALYAICKLKAPLLTYLFAKDKEANITTTVAQSKVLIDPGCGKRIKFQCKECGGNGICEHGRERTKCKECGGASICGEGAISDLLEEWVLHGL